MKKMFLKIKKVLKGNQLFFKISALLVVFMILVSSFTVSSFAADEEETTNSITDVWTSITGSIVSLLGSAQNVFLTNSSVSGSFVLPQRVSESDYWVYPDVPFSDHSLLVNGSILRLYFPSISLEVDIVLDAFEEDGVSYLSGTTRSDDSFVTVVINKDSNSLSISSDFILSFSNTTVHWEVLGSPQLSFLGILAVLGLALGIILLLVYVIVNFLRLRG